ncbi:hypothetical protein REB14_10490 [Chryseobacterium sp. ES2]|uniref:Uncharacterized protein n=1 Tax=Chryseobacterium metallicongregator TaxID=3073042 RepID=A0ABU1E486_9FLAO|nr:hypothetical protein [Chryseobacterium sp. ES2]MDR4952603.1 hypothetical protein [Chryseobacterium sp. ES2]
MEAVPVCHDMQAHCNDDATALSFETKNLEAKIDLQPNFFPQFDGHSNIYYRNGGKNKSPFTYVDEVCAFINFNDKAN